MTQSKKRAQTPQRPAPQQRRAPAGTVARRPAAPVRRSGGGSGDLVKLIIVCAAAVALGLFLQCLWPNGFPILHADNNAVAVASQVSEIYSDGPLRINELMTSNRATITLEGDESPDWIEIANIGQKPVKLDGYTLSKTAGDVRTFTFPEMTLEAGQCALVYADSRLRDAAGEELHAPFRLSSAGDTLMLFNPTGTAIDTVNIPALSPDVSYARMDTYTWQNCDAPTPALANTRENYDLLQQPAGDSPVILTELMSTNTSTLAAEDGLYYDYIELTNRSGDAVDLNGWYLSDDGENLRKWRFPALNLNPGESLVVFASKLDRREDAAHLHTNFGLSSEGEVLLLVSPEGRIMDRVEFGLLKANTALVFGGGSWATGQPTPGSH